MSIELSTDRCRQAVQDHTDQLARFALATDRSQTVPTCPDWTMTELVEHLGLTLHWVSEIVERRITDPTQLPGEVAELPTERDAWPGWLAEGAQRMVAAFSGDALDAPVFNAAGDERTGGKFWLHSLLNETVVHGADAARTAGEPYEVDADVAAALITNHLKMLTSPTWAALRPESVAILRGSGETLHWHATNEPELGDAGEWFIERTTDGASWHHRHGKADVAVRGPADSLLLLLTRRLPLNEAGDHGLLIEGDAELVRHWIEHTAHQAD